MLYLGMTIREHRMKKGLTQEQLAYHLGVSSQTVSRWENETTYPDIVMLPILADYFDISIDQLMGYAKECSIEAREQFFADIRAWKSNRELSDLRICYRRIQTMYIYSLVLRILYMPILKSRTTKRQKRRSACYVTESCILISPE